MEIVFVSSNDFNVPPYKLANLDDGNMAAEFASFVSEQTTAMLKLLLGEYLYDKFIEGLTSLPNEWNDETPYVIGNQVVYGTTVWEALANNTDTIPVEGATWHAVEVNNRWLLLKKGDRYTYRAKINTWVGVDKMLKPFVYAEWLRSTNDSHSGTGIVIADNENSTVISSRFRIVSAWNAFSIIAGNCHNQQNSLFGYLKGKNASDGTFDDSFDETFKDFNDYLYAEFTDPGRMNTFNL